MAGTVRGADPVEFDRTCPLMGVEEEYLVVDPETRAAVPRAGSVVARAAAELGDQVGSEITKFQVEARTEPCASALSLHDQLRRLRSAVADAARCEGLAVVATGTPVLGDVVPPPITDHPRYGIGIATYRALHDEQCICAGHVHVHLPDREHALLVGNHLRPWLPVLCAMMANSPFWAGRDTGYASWRALALAKWPVAGPPPYFTSLGEYETLVRTLTGAGVLVDPGTIFWDIRISARLPTLEIRVSDVPGTPEESVLLAVVVRALVVVALARVERGDPGPPLSAEVLRAACWRAARDGLGGQGIDPVTGRLMAAADRVAALVEHARPGLEQTGDLDVAVAGVERLAAGGTGAARQQAVYARSRSYADVVDYLVDVMSGSRQPSSAAG
jgi:glutamate---cysteine ligase / carboxylate-amine ligase